MFARVLYLSALVSLVAAHGTITAVKGANGITGAGMGIDPNTPRDGTAAKPFQQDTSVIRDREIQSGKVADTYAVSLPPYSSLTPFVQGKYLEIMFNSNAEPIGAQITNYLLEKGRVVGQINKERDFHIFYQFTKGASDEQREAFGLQGPDAYSYTSRSNCLDVASIDDVKDFHDTLQAMNVVGLTAEEQNNIFRMIAAILWLGNTQFVESEDGSGSTITDTGVTDFVAYLLEVDAAAVSKAMVSKTMETQRGGRRGSVYDVPLNPAQAASGRDALAKAIYNNLFEWIVSRVNISMKPRQATAQVIGVLDIYGFEIFQNNSFEQLCINYVNEKLQQIFIELTLKTEQEEYVREEIKWTPIDYFNNKIVCDLIEERRPPGIFAALNDATATAHADPAAADSSFIQRSAALASNPHFESRGGQFLVKHYAGDVMYTVAGMTDKNKDALVKDLVDLIIGSGNAFLQSLFPDRPDPNSKKRPPSAGDKIKTSAGALVENLMRSQPAYIRTIKPNQNRSATEYDNKAILHQIKYLGLQENIRVRRAGFAYRNTFEKMVERFYLLSPNTSYAGEYTWTGDARSGCEKILTDVGIAKEEWQMGVTKAFIKNPETLFALETMRDRYWHNMAARIQRAWRNYMRYKNEAAARIQRFWKNNKESIVYAETRQYGHDMLKGRKERRRYSLLGYRRFMGDYLDVGGRSALGATIKDACGIPGSLASWRLCSSDDITHYCASLRPYSSHPGTTPTLIFASTSWGFNGSIQESREERGGCGEEERPSQGPKGERIRADWKEGFKKKQVGVSDMTLLTTISNDSVNDNLEKRWKNGEIYTYIGQVLISVNPFKDLGIYTEAVLESYKGKNRLEMPPHVFAIAESSYYNMKSYKDNQCVIISGESGAGKTEAAKRIMQYIAAVSGGQDNSITEIKEMVLATNPLLESFGCAKTLRNDNSSRHGKYLEIMFNSNAEPIGAQITNYLLEKGRVVGQINKERDFHIFYQFTKGASDEQRGTYNALTRSFI
ncbi:unnamed protein product [Rhizoctonia solani]|uniref:Myosin motor domain-containing protein n=1 Tax=Rhizoctonia solani TaxID=456999 RepID=A0A8H3E148_9AGAM|nr:unnamed protein product [Rhizoctonia solani]